MSLYSWGMKHDGCRWLRAVTIAYLTTLIFTGSELWPLFLVLIAALLRTEIHQRGKPFTI